jgi:hypothetical protein
MRHINVTFSDDEFEQLKSIKGNRDWRTAIQEEFGMDGDDDE